jgi:NADPH:quinone reductase-like Zn-dependent oxidoreductase
MRGIIIRRHGGLEALEASELAEPALGPADALVEVRAVGVNHLDLWVRSGVPGHVFPLPLVPGNDVAGVVRATGPGATHAKVGSEVVVSPGLSCGHCIACMAGDDHRCREYGILGESRDGGCAELIAVPERMLLPKPAALSFEQCAAVGIPFLTAWHMLVARAELSPGETVLVQAGGSGVGSAAIQIARLWNATVITTVGDNAKAERARALGAHHVINYTTDDVARAVRQLTDGRGAEVVIDHVGAQTFAASLRALAWHGRFVTCGATVGAEVTLNLRQLFFKSLSLLGSTMGSRAELATVLAHVAAGRLHPVIDRVLPLAEVATAHRLLEERQVFGKIVLVPRA